MKQKPLLSHILIKGPMAFLRDHIQYSFNIEGIFKNVSMPYVYTCVLFEYLGIYNCVYYLIDLLGLFDFSSKEKHVDKETFY